MPLMEQKQKLLNFFIFNSKFGQEEGKEHRKLLYYYPKKETIEIQVRNVSLAEAITRFSSTFASTDHCESLHTQKTHQMYYEPESNIWMVMTASVGWVEIEKEPGPQREYQGEKLQDEVLRAELIRSYNAFKLKFFTFGSSLEAEDINSENPTRLKGKMNEFFDVYLSRRDLVNGGIVPMWGDVSFLPLDKQGFLRIQCCLSMLQASFPSIVHTAFIYKTNFVWSGFSSSDLPALSQYLLDRITESRTTTFPHLHLSSSHSSGGSGQYPAIANVGSEDVSSKYNIRFLSDGSNPSQVVYIHGKDHQIEPHHLIIFAVNNALVCLTLPADHDREDDLFERLRKALEGRVCQVVSELEGTPSEKKKSSDGFYYLHHNRMNLATKSTLPLNSDEFPADVLKTIVDVHSDLTRISSSEVVVKTACDYWVVGRSGNGRESFVVLGQRGGNLAEVTDEVARLSDPLFSNVFLVK